jgi:anaerobic selenocysteine-containing dehydrogenase
MKIIFLLAKKLGLDDKFWDGDVETAFNYMLAPSGIDIEQIKNNPDGVVMNLSMTYQKYNNKDKSENFVGFPTPSKRVELYSDIFLRYGYSPLPFWKEPPIFKKGDNAAKYPMIMITTKVAEYCHSQHRSLPSLRKRVREPYLEINPKKASELGIKDKEKVILETPYGGITLKAKITDTILENVVANQNGWWQSCPELNLPGYDAYSEKGANDVLLHNPEPDNIDTLSSGFLVKGTPCTLRKI